MGLAEKLPAVKGYQIQKKLGEGGFGAVYLARQTSVERDVAVKIIRPHFANQPDFIRRFETEAQTIANLEHIHIVPLHDYWRDPDGAYLVMRYLRGGSLRDAIRDDGPYDIERAEVLLSQIASALETAHKRQVIHRDIKPENILLDEDGNAYLADFGIAKNLKAQDGVTGDQDIVGSLDYLSPEQARSEPVTPRTDVYTLGVVLYEMLTGTHPWPQLSSVERLYKHINDPLPDITDLDGVDLDALNAIIQKATAKNPQHRYATPLELAAAFRDDVAGAQLSADDLVAQLTRREQEVLQGIIDGKSNKEIAADLVIELSTVKWYIRQIYSKLDVRSRVQAVIKARELNLITDEKTEPAARLSPIHTQTLAQIENPYKGLRAFTSADALDFFGRERLVEKLATRLAESRFLAVVGPSGSGKSSAVRAGLIPALWRGDVSGSDQWYVIDMLPGARPLDQLEVALTRVATDQSTPIAAHLSRDSHGLLRCADLILPDDGSELVVVVDQFEEAFTLVENEHSRQHFLDLLRAAATDPRSRVRVIVTLRADFYDRPLRYPEFGALLRANMETILPLSAEELERAIIEPARRVGVVFERGLVTRLVGDMNYQAGALPLLQYALTELFDRREGVQVPQSAYDDIGGAVGALAQRAETTYQEMTPAQRAATRQMFMRLVTLGEGADDTRRRTPRPELLAITDDPDMMDEIIDTFGGYRLLSLDHDPDTRTPTVEVAHEAILNEWQRLRTWLDESRADIRLERMLAAATDDWQQADQDPSYLLRGSRLEQVRTWAGETGLALTGHERQFLDTSIAEAQRQETLERERERRELETQRQLVDQQRRAANRLRYLVGGLAIFLIAAIVLTLLAVDARNEAQTARDSEAVARAEAEDSLRYTEAQRLGLEAISLAQSGAESDLVGLLAVRSLNTEYTPQGDYALQQALQVPYPLRALRSDSGVANANFAVSPDETLYAIGKIDGRVEIWDAATDTLIDTFDGAPLLTFLPDGERIVACDKSAPMSPLIVYDRASGESQSVTLPSLTGGPWATLPLPDGETLVVTSTAGDLILVDTNTWQETAAVKAHDFQIPDVAVSPDGQLLATASGDFSVKLWRLDTLELVETFRNRFGDFYVLVDFSPNGTLLAAGNAGGHVTIWDIEDPSEPLYYWEPHVEVLWGLEFAEDSPHIISASKVVRVWDYRTGQDVRLPIFLPGGRANDAELLSDGRTLLVASLDDPTLWVYDLDSTGQILTFPSDIQHNHVAFSPDGTQIAQTVLSTVQVIDLQTGEMRAFEQNTFVNGVQFTNDGQSLYFGAGGIGFPRLDLLTGDIVETIGEGAPWSAFGMDFDLAPDGRTLVSKNAAGYLVVWDTQTDELVIQREDIQSNVGMVVSPDERYVLALPPEGDAALVDTRTWEPVWTYPLEWAYSDAAFSPDGAYFAIGGAGPLLSMWETETQAHVRDFDGHYDAVWSVAFTPDNRYLLSGSTDGTARLWEVETGQEVRRFGPGDVVAHVTISPDGQQGLVVDGRTAYVWPLDLQASIDTLCGLITRDFTDRERAIYGINDDDATCPG